MDREKKKKINQHKWQLEKNVWLGVCFTVTVALIEWVTGAYCWQNIQSSHINLFLVFTRSLVVFLLAWLPPKAKELSLLYYLINSWKDKNGFMPFPLALCWNLNSVHWFYLSADNCSRPHIPWKINARNKVVHLMKTPSRILLCFWIFHLNFLFMLKLFQYCLKWSIVTFSSQTL